MKFLQYFLIFFGTCYLLNAQNDIEWDYLNGPFGGVIKDIERNDANILFTNSSSSVFRSYDNGKSWEKCLISRDISDIGVKDSILILLKSSWDEHERAIFLSHNLGDSFIRIENFWGDYFPRQIKFSSDSIFLLLSNDDTAKVFFSINEGYEWEQFGDNIDIYNRMKISRMSIDYDGSVILIGAHYNGMEESVIYKNKNGQLWKEYIIPLPSIVCLLHLQDDNYVVGTTLGLFRSKDLNFDWQLVNEEIKFSIIDIHESHDNSIILSTENGIIYSSDNGISWENRSNGFIHNWVRKSISSIDGEWYAATSTGFFYSIDKGKNWIESNEGLCASIIHSITFDKMKNVYVGTNGLYKSTDNGNTWECQGYKDMWIGPLFTDYEGNIIANAQSDQYGIFRSSDNGESWHHIDNGLRMESSGNCIRINNFGIDSKGIIYAAASQSYVKYSEDNGLTWHDINNSNSFAWIAINSEDEIFAISGLYIYSSKGDYSIWELSHDRARDDMFDFNTIIFKPNTNYGIAAGLGFTYETYDNGESWIRRKYSVPSNCLAVDSANGIWSTFSSTTTGGGYHYLPNEYDSTQRWIFSDSILEHKSLRSVAVSPEGYVFLGTSSAGVYRSKKTYLGVENELNSNSNSILEQNVPNPVQNSTKIKYSLLQSGHVRLKISNILGEIISTPIDGYKSSGEYTLDIDCSEYFPGVYCYTLEFGDRRITKKFVVKR